MPTATIEFPAGTALSVIRKAILAELKRQGRSRYWLTRQCDDVSADTIYKFLRADSDASLRVAERLMEVLRLRITPGEQSPGDKK